MKYIFLLCVSLLCFAGKSQTLKDCSSCSTQAIKKEQLNDLSIDEIRLLTNELYARKGYQFENYRFQEYFESKPWYQSKNDNKSIQFNEIEKQNINVFQEQTKLLKAKQATIATQLKTFKELVLNDKREELKFIFGFYYEDNSDEYEPKNLKSVLSKINLDEINYYKSNGLNSVTIDNGFVKILYEVSITGNNIDLFYNYMSHSKLIEELDEFTSYYSESEYMSKWQFELKGDKMIFKRLVIAG